MGVELTKIEKAKNLLLLQFEGVCRRGSSGNDDADYIIEQTRIIHKRVWNNCV